MVVLVPFAVAGLACTAAVGQARAEFGGRRQSIPPAALGYAEGIVAWHQGDLAFASAWSARPRAAASLRRPYGRLLRPRAVRRRRASLAAAAAAPTALGMPCAVLVLPRDGVASVHGRPTALRALSARSLIRFRVVRMASSRRRSRSRMSTSSPSRAVKGSQMTWNDSRRSVPPLAGSRR